jgi:hypothetical protein
MARERHLEAQLGFGQLEIVGATAISFGHI